CACSSTRACASRRARASARCRSRTCCSRRGVLELARPLALLALALPLLILVLARWLAHPLPLATGTLAIWLRTGARDARRSERVRARIPPAVWVLAFGLLCGALALAGPRLRVRREPALWRIVVDRSPSMYLVEQG